MTASLVKARDILQMIAEGVSYEDALERMPLGVDWESLITIELQHLLQRFDEADKMEEELNSADRQYLLHRSAVADKLEQENVVMAEQLRRKIVEERLMKKVMEEQLQTIERLRKEIEKLRSRSI